jgi:tetratricopeptide (TPR) repeat protein
MVHLTLNSILSRRILALVGVAAFLYLAIWVARVCIADQVAGKPTVKNLNLAIRLDPGNSQYHLRLARMAQYSLENMNPELAMAQLTAAARLNPRDPQPWLELSAAQGFQGNAAAAESSLRRADLLAPNLPSVQWVIGNFFLLHGDVDEAFRHFKTVLDGSAQYNQILFSTAWKATGDGAKILSELIPEKVATEIDYLNYLLSQKQYPEAQAVWKRVAASPETFPPERAAAYIDSLIGARLVGEAAQVWSDLQSKGLIRPTYQARGSNLLVNGDFEEDLLNMGFDWRLRPREGIYVGLDGSNFHSPSRALLITFSGKENVDFRDAFQFVRVSPGRSYRLTGFLKTEGITTDSGPRLEVRDAYDSSALQKFSEGLTGSSGGWSQAILDFSTGAKTELIVVGVARLPSAKLDNLIAGKVWVDDLSLAALPTDAARVP